MKDGEIIQIGEPHTIYEHPNSCYVADFIGSINIFESRVIEDEENYVFQRSSLRYLCISRH